MRTNRFLFLMCVLAAVPSAARGGVVDRFLAAHSKPGTCYIASYSKNLYYLVEMDPEKMKMSGSAPLPLPMRVTVLDRKGGRKETTLHTMKQFEIFFKPLTDLIRKSPGGTGGLGATGLDDTLRGISPWTMALFTEKSRSVGLLIPKPYTIPSDPVAYIFDTAGRYTGLYRKPEEIKAALGTNSTALSIYDGMVEASRHQRFFSCAEGLGNLRTAFEMNAIDKPGDLGIYGNATAENICNQFTNEKNCDAKQIEERIGAYCKAPGGGPWKYETGVDISNPSEYKILGVPDVPGACLLTITPHTPVEEIRNYDDCVKPDAAAPPPAQTTQ